MSLNALFVGSTGLRANSTALDVIGHNLANLNTTGFKSQRIAVSGSRVSNTQRGIRSGGHTWRDRSGPVRRRRRHWCDRHDVHAGDDQSDRAKLGCGHPGQWTVRSLRWFDNRILGAGSFSVDAGGFLVDPNTGFRVQRTGAVGEGTATAPGFQVPGNLDIRIPIGAGLAGLETGNVTYQGNLSSSMAVGDTMTTAIQVYDSQSTPRSLTVTYTKTAANTFTATATISGGTATIPATPITFDTAGLLVSPATLDVAVTGIAGAAPQTITLNLGTPGQATGLTQFGGASTATAVTQDGTGFGTLQSVSYDTIGQVIGQFSNGRSIPIAQLAIAGFNNEAGLLRNGDNYFLASPASGSPVIGPAGSGGLGTIQGGALEGSNVDVATEFSLLIIAQRGFQVNARTITVASDTLQELANIIR